MFSKEKLFERITIDPKIMAGKLVIKGTRLTALWSCGNKNENGLS